MLHPKTSCPLGSMVERINPAAVSVVGVGDSDAGPPGFVTCDRIERVPTHQNLLKNFQKFSGVVFGVRPLWILGAVASDETHLEVPIAQERAGATRLGWLSRVGTLQRAGGACIGTDPAAGDPQNPHRFAASIASSAAASHFKPTGAKDGSWLPATAGCSVMQA